jgi:hypothetical protein
LEEDPDEPCERFLEDSPACNVENEIKTEAEEVNAGTNEEKTEDSSSAVHIKKVIFFLQETVSILTRKKFLKTFFVSSIR